MTCDNYTIKEFATLPDLLPMGDVKTGYECGPLDVRMRNWVLKSIIDYAGQHGGTLCINDWEYGNTSTIVRGSDCQYYFANFGTDFDTDPTTNKYSQSNPDGWLGFECIALAVDYLYKWMVQHLNSDDVHEIEDIENLTETLDALRTFASYHGGSGCIGAWETGNTKHIVVYSDTYYLLKQGGEPSTQPDTNPGQWLSASCIGDLIGLSVKNINDYITNLVTIINNRIDVLENEMDGAEGRIGTLEGEMNSAESRIGVLENEMDNAESRLTTLENQGVQIQTSVQQFSILGDASEYTASIPAGFTESDCTFLWSIGPHSAKIHGGGGSRTAIITSSETGGLAWCLVIASK